MAVYATLRMPTANKTQRRRSNMAASICNTQWQTVCLVRGRLRQRSTRRRHVHRNASLVKNGGSVFFSNRLLEESGTDVHTGPETLSCQPMSHNQGSPRAQTQGESGDPRARDGHVRRKDALCPGAGQARVPSVGEGLQGPETLQGPPGPPEAPVRREAVLCVQPGDQRPGR